MPKVTISETQVKALRKRCVLRLDLKDVRDGDNRVCIGTEFHTQGAWYWKDLAPALFKLTRGTQSSLSEDDRSDLWGVYMFMQTNACANTCSCRHKIYLCQYTSSATPVLPSMVTLSLVTKSAERSVSISFWPLQFWFLQVLVIVAWFAHICLRTVIHNQKSVTG